MGSIRRWWALGAVALGMVVGCGSSNSSTGYTDGGSGGDGTVDSSIGADGPHDAAGDVACTGNQTACDGGCVNTQNDPNNCGTCGHACGSGLLCSGGQCSTTCNPPETTCNGSPPDGGADAGDAAAGGDGGAPYCANLGNDNNNCGVCGKVCPVDHTCSNGSCVLNCPPSKKACQSANMCINLGTCCTTADCTIPGETCPSPGGQCTCPAGQKPCTANNQCIPMNTCCTTSDCPVSGETCSGPGGTCSCATGNKPCTVSNTCIPTGTCCMNSDCPVMGETCPTPGGMCSCASGFKACPANNTCIMNSTCCTTADCTVMGETCSGPGGMCACPTGQKVCPVSNTCIPTSTCCSSADCMVQGELCSGPGGTCNCPAGEKVCMSGMINACILNAQCCTNADCTGGEQCLPGPGGTCQCPTGTYLCNNGLGFNGCIMNGTCCSNASCMGGAVCPAPGGMCSCPVGETYCSVNNQCIPSPPASCCTGADCPLTPHTTGTSCSGPGGTCSITACASGWWNVDGQYADGCECQDDTNSQSCAAPTLLGSLAVGASTSATGELPGPGEEKWFAISFTGNTNFSYHPAISIAGDAGIVFDVESTCGNPVGCGQEGGGCTAKTSWEVFYTNNPPNPQFGPIPPVGNNGTVIIHVYRASGVPTCNTFTLTISN